MARRSDIHSSCRRQQHMTILDEIARSHAGRIAGELKAKIHGPGHSADWVHGYWKACDDLAAALGVNIGGNTDTNGKEQG